jgi:hypothetical protein
MKHQHTGAKLVKDELKRMVEASNRNLLMKKGKAAKMTAQQIIDLQDMVEDNSYDPIIDRQALFQSNQTLFVHEFNKTQNPEVSEVGDILDPAFSEDGFLLGFVLRKEYA